MLDAREEAPFADAHPFFAVCLPLSQVELRAFDLMPRKSVPVVVYDGGEGLASRVAGRLGELGYSDVSLLEGGLEGYARERGSSFETSTSRASRSASWWNPPVTRRRCRRPRSRR